MLKDFETTQRCLQDPVRDASSFRVPPSHAQSDGVPQPGNIKSRALVCPTSKDVRYLKFASVAYEISALGLGRADMGSKTMDHVTCSG